MKTALPRTDGARRASTLVIVLWIAFGLVSLTLYFAYSMTFELRASDNRVCGLASEEAIEGAARYVGYLLTNMETNGVLPDPTTYPNEAVPIGDSHFWLIGRETNSLLVPDQVTFGLVDEASKLNLNTASSNMLVYLPRMNLDLLSAILDWRDTNGGSGAFQSYYAMQRPGYDNKCAPFDTVEEVRMLYATDMDILRGEDLNQNGILDPNENDQNRDGRAAPGILDYLTVYSREPNTYSNGTARINIRELTSSSSTLQSLLQSALNSSRANQVLTQLGLAGGMGGGGRPGRPGGGGGTVTVQFNSPLDFYRKSGMTLEEFAAVADALTVTNGAYIEGRVNVNTASPDVLACLPGIADNPDLANTLVSYRNSNPNALTSVAWVAEALGSNNSTALDALAASDCITTRTYQFTADIAALGPHGRGYRRVRFVFDTSDGTPKIVYRQDLTHLGWALGKDVRQTWVLAKDSNDRLNP